ncbi:hypothetical protein ACIQ7D_27750 [Streptomyces sp. NPDC096310]|uniref:hypothetical protein n=1 Tax=Streptomyces sp. NPDC096310 TaxID=3366082 RepID=UPI003807B71B
MNDQRKSDTKDHETRETRETPETPEPHTQSPPAPPVTPRPAATSVTPVKPLHAPDAAAGATRTPRTPQPPPTQDPAHAPSASPAQAPSTQASAAPPAKAGRAAVALEGEGRLFPRAESDRLSERLQEALNSFVDGPRRSVEEAAGVLEEAARQLTTALAERPRSLRAGWDGDRDARAAEGSDTEELRLALQSYREMTQRLLRV